MLHFDQLRVSYSASVPEVPVLANGGSRMAPKECFQDMSISQDDGAMREGRTATCAGEVP